MTSRHSATRSPFPAQISGAILIAQWSLLAQIAFLNQISDRLQSRFPRIDHSPCLTPPPGRTFSPSPAFPLRLAFSIDQRSPRTPGEIRFRSLLASSALFAVSVACGCFPSPRSEHLQAKRLQSFAHPSRPASFLLASCRNIPLAQRQGQNPGSVCSAGNWPIVVLGPDPAPRPV